MEDNIISSDDFVCKKCHNREAYRYTHFMHFEFGIWVHLGYLHHLYFAYNKIFGVCIFNMYEH